jgi:hypothetical protein
LRGRALAAKIARMSRGSTRTWRFGAIFALAGACGACASRSDGDALTAEQLPAKPTPLLCEMASKATSGKDMLLQELLRRHAIGDAHVAEIAARKVVIGMNSCETIAAWGLPTRYSSSVEMDYGKIFPSAGTAASAYEYLNAGLVEFDANGLVIIVARY